MIVPAECVARSCSAENCKVPETVSRSTRFWRVTSAVLSVKDDSVESWLLFENIELLLKNQFYIHHRHRKLNNSLFQE